MLRIKVELVPHGVESMAEILDEIVVANDGTGHATGPAEGGYGNYNVFDVVDSPIKYACIGHIRGVTRTPKHRLFLAEQALGVVQEAHEYKEKITREFNGHEP